MGQRQQLTRRVLLVVCSLLAISSIVAAPVNTAPESLLDDLADDQVRQVSATCPGDRWIPGLTLRFGFAPFSDAPLLCWLTDTGTTYQATLAGPLGYERPEIDAPVGNLLIEDVEATVQATADTEGLAVPLVDGELITQRWYRLLAEPLIVLILLGAVLAVFTGAQPRRFTRLGTCVIVLFTPLLLGVIWWLVREAPWSRRARAMPAPVDGWKVGVPEGGTLRRRGPWTALVVVVVAVALVNAAGFGLRPLLAGTPEHDPGGWVVVNA